MTDEARIVAETEARIVVPKNPPRSRTVYSVGEALLLRGDHRKDTNDATGRLGPHKDFVQFSHDREG